MLRQTRKYNLPKSIVERVRKLKWIDVLGVVTFFLILMIAFLFLLRQPKYVTITLRLLETNAPASLYNFPRQLYVENLQKGLKEKDQLGNTIVEILDIYRYPSSLINQDVYATLKVRSIYNGRTGQYTYDGLPLLIGDFRSFRLQNILLSGVILDINASGQAREKKEFSITGFLDPTDHDSLLPEEKVAIVNGTSVNGIKNFMADQIKPGLKIVDSQGTVIAEIISVNKTPGKITFIQNNNYITANDPDRKHVEVTVNVLTEKIGDDYYFQKENALTVGGKIYLNFDNLNIRPTITSVKEVK